MLDIYQYTLSKPIELEGKGLHSGIKSKIKIFPGQEDTGIIFKRVDLKENNLVLANYKSVCSAKLCTTLKNEYNVEVSTVEHLLAALYISNIDNALIEINCKEVPIMDGSAKEFLNLLKKTKLKKQNAKRKYLKIVDKLNYSDGKKKISIQPSNMSFEIYFQLDYENKIIGKQKNHVNFNKDNLEDIYNSRTFCLYKDIQKIKELGLAKGGSLDNAVVVDEDKILNKDGLRNSKEFVNHKILDLAGDFMLSGYRVLGKVDCYHGGHKLTNQFLRELFKFPKIYTEFQLKDITVTKKVRENKPFKLAAIA
tara:strand:- start:2831 stop:3757 length:927 start_codon:yes stop_codon:yes gene_type:complete